MDLLAHQRRQLAWTAWADRETLASMRAAGAPPADTLRWLAHIAAAERLWLARLQGTTSPLAVWPDLTLEQCAKELEAGARDWRAWLDGLTAARLMDRIAYRNSKGETFSSTVADILAQVASHSGYHRGQIAAALRSAGHTPVLTDYIHAVRSGAIR